MDLEMGPVQQVEEVDEVQRGIISYDTGDHGTIYTGLVE